MLIVSDVDGTLIDGTGRAPCSSSLLQDGMQRIARAHGAACSVALASSRTLHELVVLQRALGLVGACIAEDGAILAVDESEVTGVWTESPNRSHIKVGRRSLVVWTLGDPADHLRTELGSVIAPHELDPSDTVHMAMLGFRSRGTVRRAINERRASVLLDLHGNDRLPAVREAASRAQAHLHSGGRWHTLTRGAGKGHATDALRRLLTAQRRATLRIVGIGNEENDATLLASADIAFAIRNAKGGIHPDLAAVPGAHTLGMIGTAGFVEMLDRLADMPIFDEATR
ncbi:MAG TPA: hypothetical protein VE869_17905 [Gemmatimonas sp.]|nr:hypothetical protein [Gemmatimonas sp.]